MGRRKNRKQERRARHLDGPAGGFGTIVVPTPDEIAALGLHELSIDDYANFWPGESRARSTAKVCGGCREFVEDQEGGRGTCLHPGSGILLPWTDTPGCDFYAASRR